MLLYQQNDPTTESQWRSIILFGRNVASYKFAFAKSLLELVDKEKTSISLKELANPFSKHIIKHLRSNDKQGTSSSSKFLNKCREYISENIDQNELIKITENLGFVNVVDAFHTVGNGQIQTPFYHKDYNSRSKKIIITDELLKLKESVQFSSLESEVEARWNLVETAWNLNMNPNLLNVEFDIDGDLFFTKNYKMKRIDVSSARDSLNGYQKGKCFYCFTDISIIKGNNNIGHVDHFFPHINKSHHKADINGIWNLVLSCSTCNGQSEKGTKIPNLDPYLIRLNKRNNFFIDSHHPLRETLINQTGKTEKERNIFLNEQDKIAINCSIIRWKISPKSKAMF